MSGEAIKGCTCGNRVGCHPDPLCPTHNREAYETGLDNTPDSKPVYESAKPYTERDIIELACRAPACPEWFEPNLAGFPLPDGVGYSSEFYSKQRVIQWPRAYAKMVLEAG